MNKNNYEYIKIDMYLPCGQPGCHKHLGSQSPHICSVPQTGLHKNPTFFSRSVKFKKIHQIACHKTSAHKNCDNLLSRLNTIHFYPKLDSERY